MTSIITGDKSPVNDGIILPSTQRSQNNKLVCALCDEVYGSRGAIYIHQLSSHLGGFDCDLCPYTIGRRESLSIHYRRKHQADLVKGKSYTHFTMEERVTLLAQAVDQRTAAKKRKLSPIMEGDDIMAACREAAAVETSSSLELMEFLSTGIPPKDQPTNIKTSPPTSTEEGPSPSCPLDVINNCISDTLELESDPFDKYESVDINTIDKIMESIKNNNVALHLQMIAHIHSQVMLAKNLDLMDDLETDQIMQEVKDHHH
jgi:SpoVK/Ycf46/Vps4 family AAA+-type ATPase